MAHANILLRAALQTQEFAPAVLEPWSALRHSLPSRPTLACCSAAGSDEKEKRGAPSSLTDHRPQHGAIWGDLMVSCQELCEAEE